MNILGQFPPNQEVTVPNLALGKVYRVTVNTVTNIHESISPFVNVLTPPFAIITAGNGV